MTTVIRLRSTVDNPDLPVLTVDGKLMDHYVGHLYNKILELGGSVTETEINALTALVENGKEKRWIDKTAYFLPFIGSITTPFCGVVPLVDKYGAYAMSEYGSSSEISSDMFAYDDNGRIKSMGYKNCQSTSYIKTPVSSSDLQDSIGTFISFELNKVDCTFSSCAYSGSTATAAIRLKSNTSSSYGLCGMYGSKDALVPTMGFSEIEDGTNINLYAAVYPVINDEEEYVGKYVRAISIDGGDTAFSKGSWSYFNGVEPCPAGSKIFIGRKATSPNTGLHTNAVKCIALIDPSITKEMFNELSMAVNEFCSALVR